MKTITQFNSINSFSTERLIAEKVQQSDLDKFLEMHNNTDVMKTLGGLRDEKQTIENLKWNLTQWEENGFGIWMFYLKDTGEWVGRGGLRRVEDIGNNTEVEVGYALMPKFWNQGFATEITKASIEIAFEVIRLDNVVCFTLTTNKTSQRVMEKAGFQYESDITHADLPHVLYRLKNYRKVEMVPYDQHWSSLYAQEAKKIVGVLGSYLREIHHIGSTAIPNMPAKPVIDIMLECDNLDDIQIITNKLNTLNYYNIRRHVIPHRSFFTRRQDDNISYHLHIRERGDPQIKRHVNFRDYIIHHPEEAKSYADLKLKLAEQFPDDINNYVIGKDRLIQAIDTKAKLWPGRRKNFLPENTGPRANLWYQDKLIKAMEANLNVEMTHFAQYINHIELTRVPGYTLVNSGLMDDTFNYVLEADFSKNDADKIIPTIIQHLSKSNVPFSWWVSPYDKPDDLGERLQNVGLINAENHVGMYCDLDSLNISSASIHLDIQQVRGAKGLQDFASVLFNDKKSFNQCYKWIADILTDDDPIELYVGYIDDKPVVRGQLVYFAQVAGLYAVATAVDERRKGYGTEIESFLLQRAKEKGFHIAVLQASKDGLPLYQRQGFKECCVFKEFKNIN